MQKPKSFRPWQPDQATLLPPSPREWLADDHQVLSSDICFWSSGDTKSGPADGLLMGAFRWLFDRCLIGVCRDLVVVGCGTCAA
jgi:hypothetical protein